MLYTKNRLFAKDGHECDITYFLDELPMFIPSSNLKVRFFRKLARMRMASELNRRGNFYLRSQGAIALEHYKHLRHLHMIHPFSDIRLIWEIFMVIVFLYHFFTIPLGVVRCILHDFENFAPNINWKIHHTAFQIFCLIDIAINFLSGYCDMKSKEIIMEPKRVAIHYLKTYFFVDLISSIPKDMVVLIPFMDNVICTEIMVHLSLIKVARFGTYRKYCSYIADTFNISFVIFKIYNVFTIVVLYFHLMVCGCLYYFGRTYVIEERSIFTFTGNQKEIITTGYFNTLYSTISIVTLSGSGHFISNKSTKVITICMWIASKIVQAIILANIIEIVMAMASSSHKYVEMVHQLKEYMRHKQLPVYVQKRLLAYYEFRFQRNYFHEFHILNCISGQLRQDIIMHSCHKLVQNVAFFKNLPLNLLLRIVSCLQSEVYLSNDVIVKANTPGDCMYFISCGTVAVYTKTGKEVCHLDDGAFFGEIALVTEDNLRAASVISIGISEVYRLDRKIFIRIVYPYPDLLNKVQYIASDRLENTVILDAENVKDVKPYN